MELEAGYGPHVGDTLFDAFVKGVGLGDTRDDHQHFARVHDRPNAHRQRQLGHLRNVVIEESRVCDNRVIGQSLDARARREGGAWLIESDVAIGTDAPDEQLDATIRRNLLLELHSPSCSVQFRHGHELGQLDDAPDHILPADPPHFHRGC